ncbi:MAG: Mur ligase family protein, partial [bacterium]|nr:Mur ligase family protein [bacterium]
MKVSIIGFGITGKAVANYLKKNNYEIFISEKNYVEGIEEYNYEIGHTKRINEADFIVISPGVNLRGYDFIDKRKVISEIELAYRELIKKKSSKIIAITGTNGKTTTTLLVEHILQTSGFNAKSCGNIGNPFISVIDEDY